MRRRPTCRAGQDEEHEADHSRQLPGRMRGYGSIELVRVTCSRQSESMRLSIASNPSPPTSSPWTWYRRPPSSWISVGCSPVFPSSSSMISRPRSSSGTSRITPAIDVDGNRNRGTKRVEVESRLVAIEGGYHGHEGMRRWWQDFLGTFPDYKIEIEEIRDLGDVCSGPRKSPDSFWLPEFVAQRTRLQRLGAAALRRWRFFTARPRAQLAPPSSFAAAIRPDRWTGQIGGKQRMSGWWTKRKGREKLLCIKGSPHGTACSARPIRRQPRSRRRAA